MAQERFIAQDEAAKQLGVQRPTLYYYMKVLGIETQKFPLDRKKYLTLADFERIKQAKEAAAERGKSEAA